MRLINKLLTLLLSSIYLYSISTSQLQASDKYSQLKPANDLDQLRHETKLKKLPLLLFFTTEDCPFCERVKSDYILPMLISGEYTDRVVIREMPMNSWNYFQTAKYKKIPAIQLRSHFKVPFFPVLLFTNYNYCELSERIIGFNTPSLYGGRIDSAIDESLKKVQTMQSNKFCGIK
ncbi:MAG: hypothetical protein HQL46_01175 [Gammaproteobacteria bacterium]|nr:hypothetical protein [Gammaproteobacteria bacterium]